MCGEKKRKAEIDVYRLGTAAKNCLKKHLALSKIKQEAEPQRICFPSRRLLLFLKKKTSGRTFFRQIKTCCGRLSSSPEQAFLCATSNLIYRTRCRETRHRLALVAFESSGADSCGGYRSFLQIAYNSLGTRHLLSLPPPGVDQEGVLGSGPPKSPGPTLGPNRGNCQFTCAAVAALILPFNLVGIYLGSRVATILGQTSWRPPSLLSCDGKSSSRHPVSQWWARVHCIMGK